MEMETLCELRCWLTINLPTAVVKPDLMDIRKPQRHLGCPGHIIVQ